MKLKILLPSRVFVERKDVKCIVAETQNGSLGLLPRRLDCVAALVPGIFSYETPDRGVVYVAVDEGVMVKAGEDVLVSVRQAIAGSDLAQLHEAVKREFLTLDAQDRELRETLAQIEGGFMRRFAEFRHEHRA